MGMTEAERRLMEDTFGINETVIDESNVRKMVNLGFPYSYVQKSLLNNHSNYATAGYYLLSNDQNYY